MKQPTLDEILGPEEDDNPVASTYGEEDGLDALRDEIINALSVPKEIFNESVQTYLFNVQQMAIDLKNILTKHGVDPSNKQVQLGIATFIKNLQQAIKG